MNNVAIQVQNLSKQYKIGVAKYSHDTLRDQIADSLSAVFRRNGRGHPREETFWALRGVSLDIKQGEVVGVIGRNGAGKSTLLKILSRITEPTEGQVKIYGRVGSLLEVGTGFHSELTGRENVYLNGAILGMKKAEIDRKFDEIVAFSEIEKFIDTPVKRYSSGMYVRLAFAVAAHLEPEVLIVDEVLAVGDAVFQKKCVARMTKIANEGRTVLFVSHNMAAIENLCNKVFLLREGQLVFGGSSKQGIEYYLDGPSAKNRAPRSNTVDLTDALRSPKCRPVLKRLEFFTADHEPLEGGLKIGGFLEIYIHFYLETSTATIDATLEFDTLHGQRVFAAQSCTEPNLRSEATKGDRTFVCQIPSLTLLPGEYRINVAIRYGIRYGTSGADWIEDAARITIVDSDYYGTGRVPTNGLFALKQHWYIE